jgi:hypothetical protein
MWQCSYCPFTSSRKWNTQVHEKRIHQDQISTSNGDGQRKTNEHHPVQGGQTSIGYQQHVQAQQAWAQQQGGRVHDLYQQHDRNHEQVNNQPQYKYIKLLDLDLLTTNNNIEYLLQNVNHFLGCFPLDRLPPFPTTFPKSMIINTQTSAQTGEHWVALVLTETRCYYFDSFALPIIKPNIHMYLEPHYKNICYLDIRIQDIASNYCGAYCVCFVLHVRDDVTYDKFIGHYYSDNLIQNDEILKHDFSKINFLVKM